MKRYFFCLIVLIVSAVTPGEASAIALADLATGELSPTNVVNADYNTFNWDYVYKYKNASSVAVDHYWILAAAHVGDDGGTGNLIINGETYLQQEVVLHPFADLALVRYDKPLPGYYLLSDSVPVGEDIIFCGFGITGNVVSSKFQAYFTDSGTGNGTKRWGSNNIDGELTYSYTGPAPLGTTTNQGFEVTISKSNNPSKTPYEAGGNVYDSGAGMFYDNGSNWELVGTMTTRTNNGFNYTGNFAVATKYHVDWIKSVIVDYDTDMDGLPDWWEAEHGQSNPEGDPDEDTFTNYEEWIADTDPNLGSSFLQLTEFTHGVDIVFSSSTNRKYQIEQNANLTNSIWSAATGWFDGSQPTTSTNIPVSDSNLFYRVRAKLQ